MKGILQHLPIAESSTDEHSTTETDISYLRYDGVSAGVPDVISDIKRKATASESAGSRYGEFDNYATWSPNYATETISLIFLFLKFI